MNIVKRLDPENGKLLAKYRSIIHPHQIEIKMFKLLLALVLFNFVKCQQTGENEAELAADPGIEAEVEGFFSSLDFQVVPSCHDCLCTQRYYQYLMQFSSLTPLSLKSIDLLIFSVNPDWCGGFLGRSVLHGSPIPLGSSH